MRQALYGACGVSGQGCRASMMYSFFETCAMNHMNPQQWLTYVLNNIKTTPEDQLPNLLPQNFDKRLLKLV